MSRSVKELDRNQDGDYDVSNSNSNVTQLYLNKQTLYTEKKDYPLCEMVDLRIDIIDRARKAALFLNNSHPWKNMKDIELMRRVNLDRYDDRDIVTVNLLESYDRIIAFMKKHLSDPFYLEGDKRISVLNKISREIASNILIHREYANAFPAKVIIENNKVWTENASRPNISGIIDPNSFTPYPKNPIIAGVFREIGLADELGSGVRNLFKYVKIYSKGAPELIEGDIFKTVIPLNDHINDHINEPVKFTKTQKAILDALGEHANVSKKELSDITGRSRSTITRNLTQLVKNGSIERIGSDKNGHWEVTTKKSQRRTK